MNRRSFLFGAGAIAAPAIIRPGILMPVSVWREPITWQYLEGEIITVAERRSLDEPMFMVTYRIFDGQRWQDLDSPEGYAVIERVGGSYSTSVAYDEEREAIRIAPPVDAPEQTCA